MMPSSSAETSVPVWVFVPRDGRRRLHLHLFSDRPQEIARRRNGRSIPGVDTSSWYGPGP